MMCLLYIINSNGGNTLQWDRYVLTAWKYDADRTYVTRSEDVLYVLQEPGR